MKKILFFISLVCLTNFTNAQWESTSLNSEKIMCIAISGSNIFAGTFNDGIYFSSDYGDNWAPVNKGLPAHTAVKALAINDSSIFAGTPDGVYFSSNNGGTWTATCFADTLSVHSLGIRGNKIFAGTNYGVYLSSDNGKNWTAINTGLPVHTAIEALAINDSSIFTATHNGVYLSFNNGGNWAASGLADTLSVYSFATSGNNIFAGTDYGVYLSSDIGKSWTSVNIGLPAHHKVYSLAVCWNKIFAGTCAGIFMSINEEINWININNIDWRNISSELKSNISVNCIAADNEYVYIGTGNNISLWRRSLSELSLINLINRQ